MRSVLKSVRAKVLTGLTAGLLAFGQAASAANTVDTYTGGATGSLLTSGNWSDGVPDTSKDAVFSTLPGIRTLTAGDVSVGSFNLTAGTGTYSIRNETSTATNSNLTLGGGSNTGNSVSGTATDLLYVATGATFNILGPNGSTGSGVLNVILGQSGSFNVAGTMTVSSNISEAASDFGITKSGVGTLTLSGVNSYTGATVLSAGTLLAQNGGGTDVIQAINTASAITLNGGTLQYKANGSAGSVTIVTGNNITVAGDSTIDVNRVGGSNTGNTISVNNLTLNAGRTLTISGGNTYGLRATTTKLAGDATLNPTSGIANLAAVTVDDSVATGTITTLTLGGTNTASTITGAISNNSTDGTKMLAVNKTGTASVWALSGTNSYSGGTIISGGTLRFGNGSLGTGPITFGTGTLQLQWASGNTQDISSKLVGGVNARVLDTNGNDVTFASSIGGIVGLTKQTGTGTLTMNGASTYLGTTTLSAGILKAGNANAFGSSNNQLTLSTTNTTLDLNGQQLLIGTLTGTAVANMQITNSAAGSATLVMGNGNAAGATWGNVIADGTGKVAVLKVGTGTGQIFSVSNTYTGGTTVQGAGNAGTLTSSVSTSGTPFGTGSITNVGGTLTFSPGASGATSLTVASAAADTRFNYGGGAVVSLARNTNTLTVTAGGVSPSSDVLSRVGRGTLVLRTTVLGNLGAASNGDQFKVTGTAPAITNGIVTPTIVGQSQTVASLYDFLTYDNTLGFKKATYDARTTTFVGDASTVYSFTPTIASQAVSGSVYALMTNSSTAAPTITGTLNVGDGIAGHQSGVILNTTAINTTHTLITGGTMNFGAAEGVVWVSGQGAYLTIAATALTGSGGITLAGKATEGIAMSTGNTFTGGLTVNGGVLLHNLSTANDGILGNVSNTLTFNGGGMYGNLTDNYIATSRSVVVTDAGTLWDANNHFISFNGNIAGTGVLRNSGTLSQITGNNTLGGLSLGGQLAVASDANIGGTTTPITFSGGTFTLMGTTMSNFGSHSVYFAGNAGMNIQTLGHVFTIDRSITGSGSFTKSGPGTVELTAANTFTGGVSANGGKLRVLYAQGASLGITGLSFGGGRLELIGKTSGTTSQTVGNVTPGAGGGTLLVDSNGGTGFNLTLGTMTTSTTAGSSLNIATAGSGVAITTTTAKDVTTSIYSGRVVFNGANWVTTASGATPFVLSGLGTYGAVDTDGGTDTANSRLSAAGSTTTALTGAWTTNTLKIENPDAGDQMTIAGSLVLTSGGLLMTGSNAFTIGGGGTLGAGAGSNAAGDLIIHQFSSADLTISAVINPAIGAQTLTKTGTGKLVLTNSNTYTGATFINGGILSISANANLGLVATAAAVNIHGGTLQVTGAGFSTARAINLGAAGGTIDILNGGNLIVTGTVGGGSLTVTSSDASNGILTLSSISNAYNNGITINSGILRQGVAGALQAIGQNAVVMGGTGAAKLQLNGISATIAGLKSGNTNAVVENGNGSATNVVLTVNTADDQTFSGVLQNGNTGVLSLIKGGGGTWTLDGNNTFAGKITLLNGIVSVNSANALTSTLTSATTNAQANDIQFGSGTVGAINGGTLRFTSNNTADYSARIKGSSAAISLNTNGQTVTFATGMAASNTGGLAKLGAGTLILSGTNQYTGATNVTVGTLRIASGGSIAAGSAVNVSGAGTLGGGGTANGAVTIGIGGTLAPGASIDTLTVGGLTFTGGKYTVEIDNTTNTVADTADKVISTGAVVLGNGVATLDLSFVGNLLGGYNQTFTLIDGAITPTGYFANLNPGEGNTTYAYSSGGLAYTIDYAGGGDLKDVTIAFSSIAVPEPASLSLLALGGLVLLKRRRR